MGPLRHQSSIQYRSGKTVLRTPGAGKHSATLRFLEALARPEEDGLEAGRVGLGDSMVIVCNEGVHGSDSPGVIGRLEARLDGTESSPEERERMRRSVGGEAWAGWYCRLALPS